MKKKTPPPKDSGWHSPVTLDTPRCMCYVRLHKRHAGILPTSRVWMAQCQEPENTSTSHPTHLAFNLGPPSLGPAVSLLLSPSHTMSHPRLRAPNFESASRTGSANCDDKSPPRQSGDADGFRGPHRRVLGPGHSPSRGPGAQSADSTRESPEGHCTGAHAIGGSRRPPELGAGA